MKFWSRSRVRTQFLDQFFQTSVTGPDARSGSPPIGDVDATAVAAEVPQNDGVVVGRPTVPDGDMRLHEYFDMRDTRKKKIRRTRLKKQAYLQSMCAQCEQRVKSHFYGVEFHTYGLGQWRDFWLVNYSHLYEEIFQFGASSTMKGLTITTVVGPPS